MLGRYLEGTNNMMKSFVVERSLNAKKRSGSKSPAYKSKVENPSTKNFEETSTAEKMDQFNHQLRQNAKSTYLARKSIVVAPKIEKIIQE